VTSLIVSPKGTPTADIEIEVLPATAPAAGTAGSPPAAGAAGAGGAGGAGAGGGDGAAGGAGAPPAADPGLFTLRGRMADVTEEFENVSMGKQRNVRNAVETVTRDSKLIELMEGTATGPIAERIPESGPYVLKAPQAAVVPKVEPGDFTGSVVERSGVEGLEIAEDVTMVACPDLMAAYQSGAINRDGVKAVQLAMIGHCERMGDRMAILDPLPDLSPQEVAQWRQRETNYDSKFAALYYPWIKVALPNGQPLAVPPSGHMAGLYARTDTQRGVHKAPANEVVTGALEAVTTVTKGEQDILNPMGVNCIRSFTGRGVRVWGARTLSSDPAWRYVNVRRLFNYVEKSLERGLQWVVF
jgi:phage tail sheath protein FI